MGQGYGKLLTQMWYLISSHLIKFTTAVNPHKSKIVNKLRDKHAMIFSHIPDLDTNLKWWCGDGALHPPILFPNGDVKQKRLIFRNPAIAKV